MKAIAAALSLFCVLAQAPAAFAEDDAGAIAHRLMIRSGLSVQLRSLPGQMEADIKRARSKVDGKLIAALVSASAVAFQPDLLQSDMTAALGKKLTVPEMNAALVWLESPAGQRVTRAEELASAAFDEQHLAAYTRSLGKRPLPAARREMLSSLVTTTNAIQSALAVQEAMALGVAVGMDTLQPPERRQGEARLRQRVRQMIPADKVQAALAQELPLVYAYTYRNVSDADLRDYVRFLESAAGRRYQDGMTAAFVEGLGRASLRVGELVAQQQRQIGI